MPRWAWLDLTHSYDSLILLMTHFLAYWWMSPYDTSLIHCLLILIIPSCLLILIRSILITDPYLAYWSWVLMTHAWLITYSAHWVMLTQHAYCISSLTHTILFLARLSCKRRQLLGTISPHIWRSYSSRVILPWILCSYYLTFSLS